MEYKAIDLEISDASHLRIRVGRRQCQWVLSNSQGRIIHMCTLPIPQLPDWFSLIEEATQLEVVIVNPLLGQTWVPNALYSPNHLDHYAAYVEGLSESPLFVDEMVVIDAQSIYRMDRFPSLFLQETFQNPRETVALHGWIEALSKQNSSSKTWFVDKFEDQLLILCFDAGQFVRHQVAECSTPEDALYILLLLAKEMNQEGAAIQGKVSGQFAQGDDLWNSLESFFSVLNWIETEQLSDVFVTDPFELIHQYTALLVPPIYANHSR
jgi:hypothetical protein